MCLWPCMGENGENGKVQAAFDLMGIRYTGSGYLGSALAMDKGLSKQLFEKNQVPAPAGVTVDIQDQRKTAREFGVGLPCVVKTCCGGSSVGVYITETEEQFQKALDEAFSYEPEVVVEAYIKGREFSVGVVGERPIRSSKSRPWRVFTTIKISTSLEAPLRPVRQSLRRNRQGGCRTMR